MQEKMEEWKKNVVQLDKDHAKGKTVKITSPHVWMLPFPLYDCNSESEVADESSSQ